MSIAYSPQALEELRTRLEQARRRLLTQIGELERAEGGEEPVSPSDILPGDFGDTSADLSRWDTERAQEYDARAALVAIERALTKFEDGSYGYCEVCGNPIPLARLRVIPEARYDTQHEEEMEARGAAMSGVLRSRGTARHT